MGWSKYRVFKKWCRGKWRTRCKILKLDSYLMLYMKFNSKWIKNLEIWSETIKHIEENIGRTLEDLDLKCIFNNLLILLAKATKSKINK